MNIAVILPSLKNKAPIQVSCDIVNQLILKGCIVDVYYFEDVVEIEFNCSINLIGLFEEFDFNKYHIIHSHMIRPDFYIWWHRKKIKAICVSTLHNEIEKVLKDYYNYIISKVFTKLWVNFLKSQDVVICLSEHAQYQLDKNHNLQNTTFIHNGRSVTGGELNQSDVDLLLLLKSKYILLGVIANLSKIKGIDQIIDSLIGLDDYCLIIVGDGPDKKRLETKVKQLGLENRCVFLGFKKDAHLFLKYIDIYMMTSYSEGFPLVLLEAAQYKKPTLCSNLPIFKEFFNKEEVVFFELNNITSLRNSILKAFDIKDSLSKNIYLKYKKKYSANIMGDNYLRKYTYLLEQ